jgi:hypothetical protein
MTWITGYDINPDDIIDYNKKFKEELIGELDEDVARQTLGRFLMHNPGLFSYLLTGFSLEPYQRLLLKGWFRRNFALHVSFRGGGKTLTLAHFFYLYCIANPGHSVMLVSGANFRSSRGTLEMIENWANKPEGALLKQCFDGDPVHKQDMWKIKFKNGSSITAIPLGSTELASNLRGFRAQVLGIDEALLVSPKIVELVLKPFLMGGADVQEKQRIRRAEDRLIAAGKMKEEERKVFKSVSKMIQISSASYQFEHLYDTYKKYLKIIYKQDESRLDRLIAKGQATEDDRVEAKMFSKKELKELKESTEEIAEPDATYIVQQYSYKMARKELIDPAILNELDSGVIPENVIKREYMSQFIQDGGSYFSYAKMVKCTVPDGETPCLELTGKRGDEYILAIDPNVSNEPHADHFAMCLTKLVNKVDADGKVIKKIPMVVHNYAIAGVELRHHIEYFLYILEHFNVVYIVLDATQGKMSDFVSMCNESEIFKSRKLNLLPIDSEFSGVENFDAMAKDVRTKYNRQANQIVQKQAFAGPFIRASNEYLKSLFDFENIIFAGKALASPNASSYMNTNIGNIHNTHPEFSNKDGGSIYDFVQYQDVTMDLVKKECSFVAPTMSSLGNISFDLPQNLRRSKDPKRNRKDSYSALLMNVWGCKIYQAAMELPEAESETDMPEPQVFHRR